MDVPADRDFLPGREGEIATIVAFLDSLESGPAALIVEGGSGIGKTRLIEFACLAADRRSFRVLACDPSAADAKLSFAGLTDLVSAVVDDTIQRLPGPQRAALEVALLRADPRTASLDRRAIAMALLSILRLLTDTGPVLVVVDDEQWLDGPTRAILVFALRRLGDLPVGILVARRPAGPGPASLDLDRALPSDRVQHLTLPPLGRTALRAIIGARSDRRPSRRTLAAVDRWSGGNPFLALEIVRGSEGREEHRDDRVGTPIPRSLLDVVAERIVALPAPTRRVLLSAAALASPTVEGLTAVAGRSTRASLRRAEAAGVIRIAGDRVFFAHPLLAAAAYDAAPASVRRRVHRRLAASVSSVEEAVWHLDASISGPDEPTARTLEEAALIARARGAPDGAAELLERACERTPPDPPGVLDRRRLLLADSLLMAGDVRAGSQLLTDLVEPSTPRVVRAVAMALQARVAYYTDRPQPAVDMIEGALELIRGEPRSEALLHCALATIPSFDIHPKSYHAAAAVDRLGDLADPDPAIRALVAQTASLTGFLCEGLAIRLDEVERAVQAEREASRPLTDERARRALDIALGKVPAEPGDAAPAPIEVPITSDLSAEVGLADALQLGERFERAREQWQAIYRTAVESGDDLSAAHAQGHLADLETRLGDWDAAERCALEQLSVAVSFGERHNHTMALARLSFLDALRGREASARARALEALSEPGWADGWTVGQCHWGIGLLELSLGRFAEADPVLVEVGKIRDGLGIRAPSFLCYQADHVEALIGLGRLGDAATLAEAFESACRVGPFAWPLGLAYRCRALLAAARGDLELALDRADAAEALLRQDDDSPFELARTLLSSGEIRRRFRRKREARDRLSEALERFDQLGAPLWAARARAGLDRIGLRPSAPLELTPVESEVARLSAQGMTNREVAAAVFLTPKTVEGVLARVYGKLAIRTRAELGAIMGPRDDLGSSS